jgi:hypothetical protein
MTCICFALSQVPYSISHAAFLICCLFDFWSVPGFCWGRGGGGEDAVETLGDITKASVLVPQRTLPLDPDSSTVTRGNIHGYFP